MRYLAVILSFLLLGISTVTCSDDLSAHTTQSSIGHMEDMDHHDQEHNDLCSPFCACACCAAPVIPSVPYYAPAPTAHTTFAFCETRTGLISDIAQPIWQPPQA